LAFIAEGATHEDRVPQAKWQRWEFIVGDDSRHAVEFWIMLANVQEFFQEVLLQDDIVVEE
jgi:hypothetical protein